MRARVMVVAAASEGLDRILPPREATGPHWVTANSAEEACALLREQRIQIALVSEASNQATTGSLIARLQEVQPRLTTVLMTDQPDAQRVIEAMREGVSDVIPQPFDIEQANEAVRRALASRQGERKLRKRIRKLKRTCRKLAAARSEVSRQVNVICNDVVTAYQELAEQLQNVENSSEYTALIGNELDLERLLRESLEYLLKKIGPMNAAVFLPATMDEFSLGGYINYDWSSGSPEMLLQHLGDVVAPRVAEHPGVLHITDNRTLEEWIGDDAGYLEDCHVLGTTCCKDEDPLAVLVMFRDEQFPFQPEAIETVHAVSMELAEYLHKIIRVHHRHLPDVDEDEADGASDDDFGLAA